MTVSAVIETTENFVLVSDTLASDGTGSDMGIPTFQNLKDFHGPYFPERPCGMFQKSCIINDNLCFAFSGSSYYAKKFLEDVYEECQVSAFKSKEEILDFL